MKDFTVTSKRCAVLGSDPSKNTLKIEGERREILRVKLWFKGLGFSLLKHASHINQCQYILLFHVMCIRKEFYSIMPIKYDGDPIFKASIFSIAKLFKL